MFCIRRCSDARKIRRGLPLQQPQAQVARRGAQVPQPRAAPRTGPQRAAGDGTGVPAPAAGRPKQDAAGAA
ncbi:hypothetical protein ABTK24_19510, partial [Acinetobacter baumannii]